MNWLIWREAALAMVEDETRRYRPTKNYLEHLPGKMDNYFINIISHFLEGFKK